ncbi:hypothetical protein MO867_19820, partial [Microbulbifer sp. OS29]
RGQDLNLRPSGYEPDELPDCSTPQQLQKTKPGYSLFPCGGTYPTTQEAAHSMGASSVSQAVIGICFHQMNKAAFNVSQGSIEKEENPARMQSSYTLFSSNRHTPIKNNTG